jgi:hypothetical protein
MMHDYEEVGIYSQIPGQLQMHYGSGEFGYDEVRDVDLGHKQGSVGYTVVTRYWAQFTLKRSSTVKRWFNSCPATLY